MELRQAQASFPSQPPSLPGAAAVVWDGGVVCDGDHFQAPHRQSLDGRLEGAEGTGECHGPGNGDPACPGRGRGRERGRSLTLIPMIPTRFYPHRGLLTGLLPTSSVLSISLVTPAPSHLVPFNLRTKTTCKPGHNLNTALLELYLSCFVRLECPPLSPHTWLIPHYS